jgi:hypothetical protein
MILLSLINHYQIMTYQTAKEEFGTEQSYLSAYHLPFIQQIELTNIRLIILHFCINTERKIKTVHYTKYNCRVMTCIDNGSDGSGSIITQYRHCILQFQAQKIY